MQFITCYIADDGTVFLPVTPPTDIRFYQGHDKAHKACLEHEMKVKNEDAYIKSYNNDKRRIDSGIP